MGTSFISYTKDQTQVIYQALNNEGMRRDADWSRYRDAITRSVVAAWHMATQQKKDAVPYASQAEQRLGGFVKSIATTLRQYQDLGPALQSTLNYHLATATLVNPLLIDSLLASERPVAERLLSSGRFPLMLETIKAAAALAAASLCQAGKPVEASKDILDMLPPAIAEIVAKNTSQRRPDGLFQVAGAPKDYAIRYAVRSLWAIYEEATEKPPKMYSTAHVKEGYDGGFYKFATAALGPAHIVDKKVLGSRILAAYNEFRLCLKQDQPTKK